MASAFPFVRFINLSNGADALLGFALPFLPDMLTSRWLSSPNAHKRLEEALQLQVHLINAFWNMGITAWDLRFVGTDELPGVTNGLICRSSRLAIACLMQLAYCGEKTSAWTCKGQLACATC